VQTNSSAHGWSQSITPHNDKGALSRGAAPVCGGWGWGWGRGRCVLGGGGVQGEVL
jgi:hypothetical protein